MNTLIISKFFVFILINFIFFYQFFFSLNFFFFTLLDEEFIICLAIFFVFILFVNQIARGVQEMLKSRIEIYVNIFLLLFKIMKKGLRRFKKHNNKTIIIRRHFFSFLSQIFLKNLSSFSDYQNFLNNYFIHLNLKNVNELVLIDLELRNFLQKKFLKEAFEKELNFLNSVKFLKKF
jgi:hypothetical protein